MSPHALLTIYNKKKNKNSLEKLHIRYTDMKGALSLA